MDLDERYFDNIYENLSREHVKLIGNLQQDDEKTTQRQIALIATALTAIVKLRNFRKALLDKRD
jgi:hypothetical protein